MRRGEVADVILGDWSKHTHWRVRDFGVQILARLGFGRVFSPAMEWLRREELPSVCASLLRALERTETPQGTDALLEYYSSSGGEGRGNVARSAWRASDKNKASAALFAIVEGDDTAAAEGAVSLARMGHRPAGQC